jgi:predicted phosphate transport protein (TIGR00153 family)
MNLLPRDEKFYDFFRRQVEIICQAADLLLEGARAGNAQLATAAVRIRDLEQDGDEVTHEVYVRLNQTFITPLDPEDIQSLSSHLDDVLDGIEEAVHRMVAYRLKVLPSVVLELCRIVGLCAEELRKAIEALSTGAEFAAYTIEINRLEEVADQLVRAAVSDLFQTEKDPILLMKLKEIYEFLEQTTDACEDVADALQTVTVKNS